MRNRRGAAKLTHSTKPRPLKDEMPGNRYELIAIERRTKKKPSEEMLPGKGADSRRRSTRQDGRSVRLGAKLIGNGRKKREPYERRSANENEIEIETGRGRGRGIGTEISAIATVTETMIAFETIDIGDVMIHLDGPQSPRETETTELQHPRNPNLRRRKSKDSRRKRRKKPWMIFSRKAKRSLNALQGINWNSISTRLLRHPQERLCQHLPSNLSLGIRLLKLQMSRKSQQHQRQLE